MRISKESEAQSECAEGAQRLGAAVLPCSPRTVIRGEMKVDVLIDFLNIVFPRSVAPEFVCREVSQLVGWKGELRERGIHGYQQAVEFGRFAVVAFGGESQRGTVLVSIDGAGCARVARFRDVHRWAEPLDGRITRVDIAADDLDGAVFDVRRARQAWVDGAFSQGRRAPKGKLFDDLGSGEGSTFYVGARASGKLARIYEKGKSLGDRDSKWVRAEVELRAKDRVIPWDVVTNPLPYWAGSYPYFAVFSAVAERVRTFKRTREITLRSAREWLRRTGGKTLNALLQEAGGDIGEVVMQLRRDGLPRRLEAWFAEGSPRELEADASANS